MRKDQDPNNTHENLAAFNSEGWTLLKRDLRVKPNPGGSVVDTPSALLTGKDLKGTQARYFDNIMIERLWRSVKYEEVYLKEESPDSTLNTPVQRLDNPGHLRVVGGDPNDPLVYLGADAKEVTPITPIPPEADKRTLNAFGGAVEAHQRFNDFEVGTKLTEKACAWIEARGEKPFFALFSTTNIHPPFTSAKRFQGTSEAGWYGDFVHELDWIVGEVMQSLEKAGVADNTLVLFTSDNGGMFNLGGWKSRSLDCSVAWKDRGRHPEVVQQMMCLATSVRGELGEFMQRGKSQRPTGSLFPDVPVISHQRDWSTVDPATASAIAAERLKRHPNQTTKEARPRRKKPLNEMESNETSSTTDSTHP